MNSKEIEKAEKWLTDQNYSEKVNHPDQGEIEPSFQRITVIRLLKDFAESQTAEIERLRGENQKYQDIAGKTEVCIHNQKKLLKSQSEELEKLKEELKESESKRGLEEVENSDLRGELESKDQQLKEMAEGLRSHGKHWKSCSLNFSGLNCTCGYEKLLSNNDPH
jgi:GTPase involved in cell partitioning and DNA repair